MPGVTQIMIQVSKKMTLSPLKINIFLKNSTTNGIVQMAQRFHW
jgi:hypothetical protein